MVTESEIKNFIFKFLEEYFQNKNIQEIKNYLTDNTIYIKYGSNNIYIGKNKVLKKLEENLKNLISPINLVYKESILEILNKSTANLKIKLIVNNNNIIKNELTIIFTVLKKKSSWKISVIHNTKTKDMQIEKLKEEIEIAKFSMEVAINQSGVYYYEYDHKNNKMKVNKSIMKLLGIEEEIENYPEAIFQSGLVANEDIEVYKKNLEDISSKKKREVSFDVRFNMPDGGICWFRKHFMSIFNSSGEIVKIIGVMSNINKLKNIEKNFSAEQNKKFNSEKALKFYYKINLTKGIVLEQKEKKDNMIIITKDKVRYEKFLNRKLKKIVDEESRKKIYSSLNPKSFMSLYLKNEELELEYRRRIREEIHWVKLRIVFLLEPQTNDILAFIYIYDISKEKENLLMLDAVMMNQNEYILRKELSSKNCCIYASENNFLKFPKGLSKYDVDDYNEILNSFLEKLEIKKNSEYLKIEEKKYRDIKKKKIYVRLCEFTDLKGEKTYKRVIYFIDKYYSLYMLVLDVSDVILNERRVKSKLEDALKNAEEIAIKAENSKKEADKANAIKTDFLARMSHDMRTPMSAIIGLTNFGLKESRTTKIINYFEQIKDSSEYLLQLINDILDMQALESGNIILNSEIFKIEKFTKKIETIIRPQAEKKGVDLYININQKMKEYYVKMDEKRLAQILINILNNAIKYTTPNNKVSWSLVVKEKLEGGFVLKNVVRDTGIGMSEKFQEHLYEPFSKEYNKLSKNEGGTGLGLAITKNLMDNMHGKIYCDSTLGKGTTFEMIIPINIPTLREIEELRNRLQNKTKKVSFKGKKVLLCEDVEINAKIVSKILQSKEFIVEHFENGFLGVEALKNNKYDIVLMDIRMPVMDGITAVKEIRKFNEEIPIIALSANAYKEDIDKSINAGMNAHLSKPIDKEELFNVMQELVK